MGSRPAFGTFPRQTAPARRREQSLLPSPPRVAQTTALPEIEARLLPSAPSRLADNPAEEPGNNAHLPLSAIPDSWSEHGSLSFSGRVARQVRQPPRSHARSCRERREAFANERD